MARTYDELVNQGFSRGEALVRLSGTGVTIPGALTSPADIPAAYNEANMQQLRDDVAALHTKVTDLINALNGG